MVVGEFAAGGEEESSVFGFAGIDVSASIWVEGVGEVVAYNPELELFPASNQKIFTAVGALMLLDQDHRFVTSVEVIDDTLVIRAGGDPTLRSEGAHSLEALALQTLQSVDNGPRRLVVDAGHFEPRTTVLGRQDWQVPTYTGPLSAFIVDDNRWRKDPEYVQAPALENAKLLATKLAGQGMAISSVERFDHYPGRGEVVASVESVRVGDLLATMMLSSDNEIAESLLRELGGGSTAAGIDAIEAALEGQCPMVTGASGDGSGLSRANLRASREWRQLLQFALTQDWAEEFVAALPIAGKSGTMASRLTSPATKGIVRAKTGTIIGGRSLSGYGQTPDGQLVVFSVVTNGEPQAAQNSLGAIDNLIAKIVAQSGY